MGLPGFIALPTARLVFVCRPQDDQLVRLDDSLSEHPRLPAPVANSQALRHILRTGHQRGDRLERPSQIVEGAGATATVDITAGGAGLLDAWIDFNGDGDWTNAGEQVATSTALAVGVNSLNITVPVGATVGVTFARFRISTAGGLGPTGLASDGEVEDHQVTVADVTDPIVTVTTPTEEPPTTTTA